ncbi:hypothetical protein KC207_13855 [Phycicoccus sp. BSK3Z-2]|uniref:Uncharacterized protein n=1 Tax=Phycicoccus avicenniae TaxID=2828860 RepID=A0A941D937_9MICO|nr:hypothetical protein [Phycicoccus avicenniae]MBR7744374.1 hypothetical protein [Phycicoccus avicenniae]
MGWSTSYLGYLTVSPPLNAAELEWLSGFADWCGLPDVDPFHLPMNPRASLRSAFSRSGGAIPSPTGISRDVGDWRFCLDGDCLSWHRTEKSNDAPSALRFLVETYLGPDATARGCGIPDFSAFTFDHRLDGLLAAQREDTDELFLIRVVDSDVRCETLVPGRETGW